MTACTIAEHQREFKALNKAALPPCAAGMTDGMRPLLAGAAA
jgi:hypothetical protein